MDKYANGILTVGSIAIACLGCVLFSGALYALLSAEEVPAGTASKMAMGIFLFLVAWFAFSVSNEFYEENEND